MSEAPKIAALVVTYNRQEALQTALPQVLAEPFAHVLVVDNASSDGTRDFLAAQSDPRLEILPLAENTGGAGGFAAGLAHLAGRFDWIVLADDDAWPEAGCLEAFTSALPQLRATSPEPLGAVAAAVHLPSGEISPMNRSALNPFASLSSFLRALRHGRDGFHLPDAAFDPEAPARAVDTGSFVGLFLGAEALAKLGPPDPGFFIYGDDTVYTLRLRKAGFGLMFAPSVRYVHDCQSLGAGHVTRPLWKVYYLTRNGIRMAWTAAGPLFFPLALTWYLLAWLRKGRHYAPEERASYYRHLRKGLWDGLRGVRGRHPEFPPPKG